MIQILFLLIQIVFSQTILSFPECNDAHCKQCYDTDLDYCKQCDEGYQLKDNKCVYTQVTEYCSSYATNGDYGCIKCIDGYALDKTTGKCVEQQELCLSWSRSNGIVCSKCCNGYALTNEGNNCVKKTLPGCTKYQDKEGTICAECSTSYSLVNGTCELGDEFCTKIGTNLRGETVCKDCTAGYYLDRNDVCQKGNIEHCLKYAGEKICSNCEQNYLNANGICYDESYKIPNCATYNDKMECTVCGLLHSLENGKCVPDVCLSKAVLDRDKCKQCAGDYFMQENFTCGLCNLEKCPNGCVNRADECKEKDSIEHCLLYSVDGMRCEYCESNYKVDEKDGSCIYYKTDPVRCAEKNSNGECIKCIADSTLSSHMFWFLATNGECIEDPPEEPEESIQPIESNDSSYQNSNESIDDEDNDEKTFIVTMSLMSIIIAIALICSITAILYVIIPLFSKKN